MKLEKITPNSGRIDLSELATADFKNTFKHSNFTNKSGEIQSNHLTKAKLSNNINSKELSSSVANIKSKNKDWTRAQTNSAIKRSIINNSRYNMVSHIKKNYANVYAIWLPSTSKHRCQSHISNYGKTFLLGKGIDGEIPNERYGCKCGFKVIEKPSVIKATIIAKKEKNRIFKSLPIKNSISKTSMILAGVAGTSFLIHKSNINKHKQLTKQGIKQYKDALKSGGGSIDKRANSIIKGLTLQGLKYNKIKGTLIENEIIIPVTIEVVFKDSDKQKLLNLNVKIAKSNKDLIIKPDGFYIRSKKQTQLEDDLLDNLHKKYELKQSDIISFGGLSG